MKLLEVAPERVCVSGETVAVMTRYMVSASRAFSRETDPKQKYAAFVLSNMSVTISDAILDSYDSQIKRATCKATIKISFSPSVEKIIRANFMKIEQDTFFSPVVKDARYTIQPSADGTQIMYEFGAWDVVPGRVFVEFDDLDALGALKTK